MVPKVTVQCFATFRQFVTEVWILRYHRAPVNKLPCRLTQWKCFATAVLLLMCLSRLGAFTHFCSGLSRIGCEGL